MLVFSISRFTIRAVYMFSSIYLITFYESLGAKITYISVYIAIGRLIDCWTDPAMGWCVTKRPAKGRTRLQQAALRDGPPPPAAPPQKPSHPLLVRSTYAPNAPAQLATPPDKTPYTIKQVTRRVDAHHPSFRITENKSLKVAGKAYRRKSFMGLGSIGYNVFLIMLCCPPKAFISNNEINHWYAAHRPRKRLSSHAARANHLHHPKNTASRFGLTYIMLFIFDTVCNIPYYAFGMELASTPAGRDQVWFWNIVLGLSVSAV